MVCCNGRVKLVLVFSVCIFLVSSPVLAGQVPDYRLPATDASLIRNLLYEEGWYEDVLQESWRIIDVSFPPMADVRQRAVTLNSAGFHYYEQGDYYPALALFSYAAHTDASYKYGHYNSACTIALLMRDDMYPENSGNERDPQMYEYLQQAIALDPAYRQKMLNDSDLFYFVHNLWFLRLAGLVDTTSAEGIEQMLARANIWYAGWGHGVYPQSPILHFSDDGGLLIENLEGFEAEMEWQQYEGSWQAYDGYVIIRFQGQDYPGTFQGDELHVPDFPLLWMEDDVFTTEVSLGC